MSFYEHVFIARQDLSPQQVTELTAKYANVVKMLGGKVTKQEDWGLRTLAYRINKNRKGYYVLMNLDAPVAAVQELERLSRIDEDIIRHLTIKVDALEEGPSAMIAPKHSKKSAENEDLGLESEENLFEPVAGEV